MKDKKSRANVSNPVVVKCVEMGFPQSHVEYAVKELKVEKPRPEMVVAWLLDHPEVFRIFILTLNICRFRLNTVRKDYILLKVVKSLYGRFYCNRMIAKRNVFSYFSAICWHSVNSTYLPYELTDVKK